MGPPASLGFPSLGAANLLFEGVGFQLPQTFPVSLLRPRHADGLAGLGGAKVRRVRAFLRIGRAACKSKNKITRKPNQILCAG